MSRCRMCPSRKLPIEGAGPIPCSVMFIAESPGRAEDRMRDSEGRGKPMQGDSGNELDQVYLPLAGLRRTEVYITNTVQCDSGGTPSPSLAECCSRYHLPGEIAMVRPDIIVTLGATALHTLFPGAPGLDTQHGIPFEASYFNVWTGTVFPMYHPAAGMRSSATMQSLVVDFQELGQYLKGHRMEQQETGLYTDLTLAEDVDYVFSGFPMNDGIISMDTEVYSLISLRPYCLSFATQPGYGFVIHHRHTEAIERLYYHLKQARLLLLHNAPFDMPILESMFSRPIPRKTRITDTMVMAYNLQSIPRGLKQLAHRYLGVTMTDFEDLVIPYWHIHLSQWLDSILPALEPLCITTAQKRTYRKAHRLSLELIDPSLRSESFDPWTRWADWNDGDKALIAHAASLQNQNRTGELLSGSMPEMSISQAPWREIVPYAGADADMTLRLYPILQRMGVGFRKGLR